MTASSHTRDVYGHSFCFYFIIYLFIIFYWWISFFFCSNTFINAYTTESRFFMRHKFELKAWGLKIIIMASILGRLIKVSIKIITARILQLLNFVLDILMFFLKENRAKVDLLRKQTYWQNELLNTKIFIIKKIKIKRFFTISNNKFVGIVLTGLPMYCSIVFDLFFHKYFYITLTCDQIIDVFFFKME